MCVIVLAWLYVCLLLSCLLERSPFLLSDACVAPQLHFNWTDFSGGDPHGSRLKCSCTLWARAREVDFLVPLN